MLTIPATHHTLHITHYTQASRASATGWKGVDKETGKRTYSTYRNGAKVSASGGEAYRLFVGDGGKVKDAAKEKEKEKEKKGKEGGSAGEVPRLDSFFRDLPPAAEAAPSAASETSINAVGGGAWAVPLPLSSSSSAGVAAGV